MLRGSVRYSRSWVSGVHDEEEGARRLLGSLTSARHAGWGRRAYSLSNVTHHEARDTAVEGGV